MNAIMGNMENSGIHINGKTSLRKGSLKRAAKSCMLTLSHFRIVPRGDFVRERLVDEKVILA